MSEELLKVSNLRVEYQTGAESTLAVDDVSLSLKEGQSLGVVGESGSGKSSLALALIGLLPTSTHIDGHVRVVGTEIVGARKRVLDGIRGRQVGLVYQDALVSLNPVRTVGSQIVEVFRRHEPTISRAAAKQRTIDALGRVGISDPGARYSQYPHEFSGGMRQRAAIAMALAADPRLLIADEVTTGLDVTVQAQILDLLTSLRRELGMSILIVSHDFEVIRSVADDVVVFYNGRIVEAGSVASVFARPKHPYTAALLASAPTIDAPVISFIPGAPPPAGRVVAGCAFEPRCELGRGRSQCGAVRPELVDIGDVTGTRRSACHFHDELSEGVAAMT